MAVRLVGRLIARAKVSSVNSQVITRYPRNYSSSYLIKPVWRRFSSQTDAVKQQLLDNVKKQLERSASKDKQLNALEELVSVSQWSNLTPTLIGKLANIQKCLPEEIYGLAVAIYSTKDADPSVLKVATQLFAYAGECGDHNAQYSYAQLLRAGGGCEPDMKKSAEIFTDLAMKGHPYAQFSLAGMYLTGMGVEQNYVRAYTLYKVSAQNKIPQAYKLMGDLHLSGNGVPEDFSEALKCYRQGTELGDPTAHVALAHCYSNGKGVEQSHQEAFKHNMKAAEMGYAMGQYNVGVQYFAGKGVDLDLVKAVEFYERAADQGFVPAQINLGNMYFGGHGVDKDWEKAKELYKKASVTNIQARDLYNDVLAEEKKLAESNNESKPHSDA